MGIFSKTGKAAGKAAATTVSKEVGKQVNNAVQSVVGGKPQPQPQQQQPMPGQPQPYQQQQQPYQQQQQPMQAQPVIMMQPAVAANYAPVQQVMQVMGVAPQRDPNKLYLGIEISDNYICGLNGLAKTCLFSMTGGLGLICGWGGVTYLYLNPPVGIAIYLVGVLLMIAATRFYLPFSRQVFWLTNQNADGMCLRGVFCFMYFLCVPVIVAVGVGRMIGALQVELALAIAWVTAILQVAMHGCYCLAYTEICKICADCFSECCLDKEAMRKRKANRAQDKVHRQQVTANHQPRR